MPTPLPHPRRHCRRYCRQHCLQLPHTAARCLQLPLRGLPVPSVSSSALRGALDVALDGHATHLQQAASCRSVPQLPLFGFTAEWSVAPAERCIHDQCHTCYRQAAVPLILTFSDVRPFLACGLNSSP